MPALTTNTITVDGTYTVPTVRGQRYTVAVSGDFGGGSLAINWNDGAGDSTAFANSPATAAETWDVSAPSNQIDLILTGATDPDIIVSIAPRSGVIGVSTESVLEALENADVPVGSLQLASTVGETLTLGSLGLDVNGNPVSHDGVTASGNSIRKGRNFNATLQVGQTPLTTDPWGARLGTFVIPAQFCVAGAKIRISGEVVSYQTGASVITSSVFGLVTPNGITAIGDPEEAAGLFVGIGAELHVATNRSVAKINMCLVMGAVVSGKMALTHISDTIQFAGFAQADDGAVTILGAHNATEDSINAGVANTCYLYAWGNSNSGTTGTLVMPYNVVIDFELP